MYQKLIKLIAAQAVREHLTQKNQQKQNDNQQAQNRALPKTGTDR